jgi:hypothetical protein
VKAAMSSFIVVALLAMTGCAQMPAPNAAAQADKPPVQAGVMNFEIPADALGAHDPQLTAVLAKAGAFAAAQKQPTTILVTALAQDFAYINQAIWKGVPARRASNVRLSLENLTASARQPYSVSIRPTQSQAPSLNQGG